MTLSSKQFTMSSERHEYGPILWTFVIQAVGTVSFQYINLLKQDLHSLHLNQINGENVITFTTQFLQICNHLGKNVPSEPPFLLNEHFSTTLVEQFHIKFMA